MQICQGPILCTFVQKKYIYIFWIDARTPVLSNTPTAGAEYFNTRTNLMSR